MENRQNRFYQRKIRRTTKRRQRRSTSQIPYHRYKRSICWSETQGKFVTFRSSYEKTYAEYLDYNKIPWMYEAKKFSVGGPRYYLPDFYLPELEKYVEVKGKWYKKSKEKFALFKELYPEIKIEIVGEEQIMYIRKSMGTKE